MEARFLKAKETPVKNTKGEFDFDEDNDDNGEAPKGGKMKGKQVQSSSTSKGDFRSSCFLLGTTHSFFTFSIGWHPKKKKFAYARNLRNGGSLFLWLGRTGSSGKVSKHSVGDSSTEKPTTSRDSEGDAAAALSPDMSPGDGEPLVSSPLIFAQVTNAFRDYVSGLVLSIFWKCQHSVVVVDKQKNESGRLLTSFLLVGAYRTHG